MSSKTHSGRRSVVEQLAHGCRPAAAKSCPGATATSLAAKQLPSMAASSAAVQVPDPVMTKKAPPKEEHASVSASAASAVAGTVASTRPALKRTYSALLSDLAGGKVGSSCQASTATSGTSEGSATKMHKALKKASNQSCTQGAETEPETVTSPTGSGVMLNEMASHMVRKLAAQGVSRFASNMDHMPGTAKLASACSGSEGWYEAMSQPFEIFGDMHMKHFNFDVAFVCEKAPMKQNYLLNLPHISVNSACCCFDNVMNLKNKTARCIRHDRDCEVPEEDIFSFACGFSCCPYSKLNPKANSSRGAVARVDSGESPASDGVDTALGNFEYISKARPLMSFMENVEEFDDEPQDDEAALMKFIESNMAYLRSKFEDEGFILASFLMNARDYGLPQSRKRMYLVAIPLDHPSLVTVPTPMLSGEIEMIVRALMLPTRALAEFLLQDDDPCVSAELERMQECKAQAKDKLDKDTKWQDEHQRVFKQHGFVWGRLKPIPRLAECPWFQAALPREKDILTLMPHVMPNIKRCDAGQGITRCRPSAHEHAGACTPGMKIFDFERMRYWVGRECLKLQGIDWENIPNLDMFSESDLNDLGGNAFATTCIMAVIVSTFASIALGPASTTQTDGTSALQSLAFGGAFVEEDNEDPQLM